MKAFVVMLGMLVASSSAFGQLRIVKAKPVVKKKLDAASAEIKAACGKYAPAMTVDWKSLKKVPKDKFDKAKSNLLYEIEGVTKVSKKFCKTKEVQPYYKKNLKKATKKKSTTSSSKPDASALFNMLGD